MPVSEFREQGYLQELNRRFLHPLGLALEVTIGKDGSETISAIWDCREDPEGIVYGDGVDADKAKAIDTLTEERLPRRQARLGYVIQPVEDG